MKAQQNTIIFLYCNKNNANLKFATYYGNSMI